MDAFDDDARPAFEARLTREARRFDLKPLFDLLLAKGYLREEILFEGIPEGSASTLVEAIRFRDRPVRGVVITLNLGLLGDNSLLPSYFFQAIDGTNDPERFYDFIRFFDHQLMENLRRSLYPEEDRGLYRDWNEVRRSFFRMLGPSSVSTMQWLTQHYFPELEVRVERWAFSESSTAHAAVSGSSRLDGTGILGRHYPSSSTGFAIELVAQEEADARGRLWPKVVRRRLHERFLPLLGPFRIPLRVHLKVLFHATWAKVDTPFGAQGDLGYDRLKGNPEEGHTTLIWSGRTRLSRVNADMPASQWGEMFGVSLPIGEQGTVWKLMCGKLGHTPSEGENVEIEHLRLTAERVLDGHAFNVLVEQLGPGEQSLG